MAKVTGFTAAHMQALANSNVISGKLVGDRLVLINRVGHQVDVGKVAFTAADATPVVEAALLNSAVIQQAVVNATPAAVSAEISARGLVRQTDPGIPKKIVEEQATPYASVWRNPFSQVVAAIRRDNFFQVLKGIRVGNVPISAGKSDDYLSIMKDPEGRIAENAIDTQGRVPFWVLSRWGLRIASSAALMAQWPFQRGQTVITKTVKKDGTGDYSTVKAAVQAAVIDSSEYRRWLIIVHPGVYEELSIPASFYGEIRGINRDRCTIKGYLPPSSTDAAITPVSTIDLIGGKTLLTNLTITGQNVRYPIHFEGSGTNLNAESHIDNCHVEHLGNQEVRDWRDANPGSGMSANTVWNSWIAYGYGSAEGVITNHRRTTFKGRSTWLIHDNKAFKKPTINRLDQCRIVGAGFNIQSLGAGLESEFTIRDSEIDALFITSSDSPWIPVDDEFMYSDHDDIKITASSCSLVGWQTTARGKALKITSATTTAGSKVRVSGTAADLLFKDFGYRDGGGGLAGSAWGQADISGILVSLNQNVTARNTIGRWLGNCSVTPKTLTVTVDALPPVDIVFNTDLTTQSNASILAIINAGLGSIATASEYLVSQGENYPDFLDRQFESTNTGTVFIPKFAAVKFGPLNRRSVELFGTADNTSQFAGIALEPIVPGKSGRILRVGRMKFDQLFGFAGSIVKDSVISLSTVTPGAFVLGSGKPVGLGDEADWATIRGVA